jgi:hypothetical protein
MQVEGVNVHVCGWRHKDYESADINMSRHALLPLAFRNYEKGPIKTPGWYATLGTSGDTIVCFEATNKVASEVVGEYWPECNGNIYFEVVKYSAYRVMLSCTEACPPALREVIKTASAELAALTASIDRAEACNAMRAEVDADRERKKEIKKELKRGARLRSKDKRAIRVELQATTTY